MPAKSTRSGQGRLAHPPPVLGVGITVLWQDLCALSRVTCEAGHDDWDCDADLVGDPWK
jgi:hypothetical protein